MYTLSPVTLKLLVTYFLLQIRRMVPHRLFHLGPRTSLGTGLLIAVIGWRKIAGRPQIFNLAHFSDEAWFHVSRYANSQNTRTSSKTPCRVQSCTTSCQDWTLVCKFGAPECGTWVFTDTISFSDGEWWMEQHMTLHDKVSPCRELCTSVSHIAHNSNSRAIGELETPSNSLPRPHPPRQNLWKCTANVSVQTFWCQQFP